LKDGQLDSDVKAPESAVFGFGRRYGPQPKQYKLNIIVTPITFLKDMSWPTPGTRVRIFEHRLYISDFRHREGYRRRRQANNSKGRVRKGINLVSFFLLYQVHSLMNAFVRFIAAVRSRSSVPSSLVHSRLLILSTELTHWNARHLDSSPNIHRVFPRTTSQIIKKM
jgi:hypothetical protein